MTYRPRSPIQKTVTFTAKRYIDLEGNYCWLVTHPIYGGFNGAKSEKDMRRKLTMYCKKHRIENYGIQISLNK